MSWHHVKKKILWLVAGIIAFVLVHVAVFSIIGLRDNATQADVAVVFGNTVNTDGSLSGRLKARLDAALALYQQELVHHIIVSGALGKEGHNEAVAMKNYLVSQGVNETAIITDSEGYTTAATAHNTHRIMQDNQWKSAIVVSQYFHIPRALYALKQAGVPTVYHTHARYFEARDIYSLLREVPAYYSYILQP